MTCEPFQVVVEQGMDGAWEITLPGADCQQVICETFDDARNIAYLCAVRGRCCELIIRDAYHRVTGRERITAAPPTGGRRRRTRGPC